MQEMRIQLLVQKDPLEGGKTTHSSILAWKILWTKEPCGLQFMGWQGVEQHTHTHTHTLLPFREIPSAHISYHHHSTFPLSLTTPLHCYILQHVSPLEIYLYLSLLPLQPSTSGKAGLCFIHCFFLFV